MSLQALSAKRIRRTWEPENKAWNDDALDRPWEEVAQSLHKATIFSLKNVFFFSHATSIQAKAISTLVHNGHSAVVEAPTGSGKTLSFLIPIMERTVRMCEEYVQTHHRPPLTRNISGVILSPSTTLAQQTFIVARNLAARFPFNIQFVLCDGIVERSTHVVERLHKIARGGALFLVTTPRYLQEMLSIQKCNELQAERECSNNFVNMKCNCSTTLSRSEKCVKEEKNKCEEGKNNENNNNDNNNNNESEAADVGKDKKEVIPALKFGTNAEKQRFVLVIDEADLIFSSLEMRESVIKFINTYCLNAKHDCMNDYANDSRSEILLEESNFTGNKDINAEEVNYENLERNCKKVNNKCKIKCLHNKKSNKLSSTKRKHEYNIDTCSEDEERVCQSKRRKKESTTCKNGEHILMPSSVSSSSSSLEHMSKPPEEHDETFKKKINKKESNKFKMPLRSNSCKCSIEPHEERLATDYIFVGATVTTSHELMLLAKDVCKQSSSTLHVITACNDDNESDSSHECNYLQLLENKYVLCEAQNFLPVLVELLNMHSSKKHFVFFNHVATLRFVESLFNKLNDNVRPLLYIKNIFTMHECLPERVRMMNYNSFLEHKITHLPKPSNADKTEKTVHCKSNLHSMLAGERKNQVFSSGWKRNGRPEMGTGAILLCTDVAAFGLDVRDVDYVYHFEPPVSVQSYVHRIGRVGRMGLRGCSVLLLPCHNGNEKMWEEYNQNERNNDSYSKANLLVERAKNSNSNDEKDNSEQIHASIEQTVSHANNKYSRSITKSKRTSEALQTKCITLQHLTSRQQKYIESLSLQFTIHELVIPLFAPTTALIRRVINENRELLKLAKLAAMTICKSRVEGDDDVHN